ncbi:MAG: hypothetical protein ACTHNB_08005 [Gaiellaceae bacterium]
MDFEARPQLDPEQEEVLTLALERLLAGNVLPRAYRSRWRAEGIAENVAVDAANETVPEPRAGE